MSDYQLLGDMWNTYNRHRHCVDKKDIGCIFYEVGTHPNAKFITIINDNYTTMFYDESRKQKYVNVDKIKEIVDKHDLTDDEMLIIKPEPPNTRKINKEGIKIINTDEDPFTNIPNHDLKERTIIIFKIKIGYIPVSNTFEYNMFLTNEHIKFFLEHGMPQNSVVALIDTRYKPHYLTNTFMWIHCFDMYLMWIIYDAFNFNDGNDTTNTYRFEDEYDFVLT